MSRIDLGKVVGEVNPKTQIPYELAESYQVPMSGDPMDVFMGKVTTDLGIHDSAIGRSDAYSDEVDYAANEYCIKDNMVYRFTKDKPMGPWDETKAVATNIITELLDMRRSLIELNSKHSVIGEQVGNFHYYNFEPPESNKSVMEDFQSELYKFPVGCTLIGDYARSGQFIFIGMVYSNRSYAFFLVLGVTGGLRIVKNWDGSWTETGIN